MIARRRPVEDNRTISCFFFLFDTSDIYFSTVSVGHFVLGYWTKWIWILFFFDEPASSGMGWIAFASVYRHLLNNVAPVYLVTIVCERLVLLSLAIRRISFFLGGTPLSVFWWPSTWSSPWVFSYYVRTDRTRLVLSIYWRTDRKWRHNMPATVSLSLSSL